MMTQEQIDMMKNSNTLDEWNANCDKVKAANGGYPSDWYEKIVVSGLMAKTAAKFGASHRISIL